jgi:methyl-accepting chemotaxis protein
MSGYKRRKKLIQPRLQFRLIFTFLGVALLALLLQFILFGATISMLAGDLPQDGPLLQDRIPQYTLMVFGISLGVLLPMTLCIGVIVTFRIAGPLYRFEQHLKAIARGEDPGVCRIRREDELQEFCTTFNAALDKLRERRLGEVTGEARSDADQTQSGSGQTGTDAAESRPSFDEAA